MAKHSTFLILLQMFSIARNPLHANVNIGTIQISQCPCFLKANYCLKIHNADFKLALLISGYVVYLSNFISGSWFKVH